MGTDFEQVIRECEAEIEGFKLTIEFWEALKRPDVVDSYKSKLKRARRRKVAVLKQSKASSGAEVLG